MRLADLRRGRSVQPLTRLSLALGLEFLVKAPDPVVHAPFIGSDPLADKPAMAESAEIRPLHEIPLDREHDPREEAEAFQRLPEAAKEEIRDAWRRQEGTHVEMRLLRRNSIRGYVIES